jgi:hypothetical protein
MHLCLTRNQPLEFTMSIKSFVAASALALSTFSLNAQADTFNFSYLSDDAVTSAVGQLFTTGSDVTAITGMVDGRTITSLIGSAGTQTSPSGHFLFDNTVYPGPALSTYGILFSVAGDISGQEWNLWGSGGNSGALHSFVPGVGYSPATSGTLSITAVPEPQTYAMLLAGLGLLGYVARRRTPA